MPSHSLERGHVAPGRVYAELGVFEHAGREFAAGGAYVSDDYLVGYLGADSVLATWGGRPIGRYEITASWPTPRSYVAARQYQVRATLHDGRTYTGRSAGQGMILRAKRLARPFRPSS